MPHRPLRTYLLTGTLSQPPLWLPCLLLSEALNSRLPPAGRMSGWRNDVEWICCLQAETRQKWNQTNMFLLLYLLSQTLKTNQTKSVVSLRTHPHWLDLDGASSLVGLKGSISLMILSAIVLLLAATILLDIKSTSPPENREIPCL